MTTEQLQTREKFKFKRLGYYQAGRSLAFSNVGGNSFFILLGYAIEMHIKAAIFEIECQGVKLSGSELRLLYGHKIKELFHLGKKYGLFQNVKVSDEFLDIAENFLHTRYPSQEKESMQRILDANPLGFGITVYNIFPYDDLICQLDRELSEIANNENDSIIILAAKYINAAENVPLFHCNAFASSTLNPIWDRLLNDQTIYDNHKAILKLGQENIWNYQKGLFVPFEMFETILKDFNCSDFKLSSGRSSNEKGFSISFNYPVGLRG